MKILIIDDNEASCQLLKKFLSGYGTLVTVNSGMDAIKAFKNAFKIDETFDLIYLDCYMPQMDGVETLKALRHIESQNGITQDNSVQIVMMSAANNESLMKKAKEFDCNSFINIPIRKTALHCG